MLLIPTTSIVILLSSLSSTLADPIPIPNPNYNHHTRPHTHCPCYTHTTTVSDPICPPFQPTKPCIYPLCLMLSTTTIPGPNFHCPTTPTATALLPCQTACRSGCGTATSTETAESGCLGVSRSKTTGTESWFTGIVTVA